METSLMKQYSDMKVKCPDATPLFWVRDFHEMYGEDVVIGAKVLGIIRARRANGIRQHVETAGLPCHALDSHLPRLMRAGKRVAVCDQLRDPELTKKLVKRGATELVTPGVSINSNIPNRKENNFSTSIYFAEKICSTSLLDISTGEFMTAGGSIDYADKLLNNSSSKEVLIEWGNKKHFEEAFGPCFFISKLDDWVFTTSAAEDRLLKHFEAKDLGGLGIQHLKLGTIVSGAILYYLDQAQHTYIPHITALSRIEEDRYVHLDKFIARSSEPVGMMNDEGIGSLDVIDKMISSMGSRMPRRWMLLPLKDVKPIQEHQKAVDYFFREPGTKELLDTRLGQVGNLERIISKVAVGRVSPHEVVQLGVTLRMIEPVKEACMASGGSSLCRIGE